MGAPVSSTTVGPLGSAHNHKATFHRVGQGRKHQGGGWHLRFFFSALAQEQAVEVVLGHGVVAGAVLKQETGQG